MEVTGKVLRKLELETGVSKAGKEWQKQSIVIDTGGEFNNEVCVSAFGDKLKEFQSSSSSNLLFGTSSILKPRWINALIGRR